MSRKKGLHDFLCRMPSLTWKQLKRRAAAEKRSATQHVVYLIEKDFKEGKSLRKRRR